MKAMKLIQLEDSDYERNRFKLASRQRTDIEIVLATDSEEEAIKIIKFDKIEGVILDLEGVSAKHFLEQLNHLALDIKPLVIITTNNTSEKAHKSLRTKYGFDWLFCKDQLDYSPDEVFDHFQFMRDSTLTETPKSVIDNVKIETLKDRKDWISNKIYAELDAVGISAGYDGRKYIFEAIYYLLETNPDDKYYVDHVMTLFNKNNSNIVLKGMETVINYAWKNQDPRELLKHYTAFINPKRGVPTPTELVHYYVEKIQRTIS